MLRHRRSCLLAVLLVLGWPAAARCRDHQDVIRQASVGVVGVRSAVVGDHAAAFGSIQAMANVPTAEQELSVTKQQRRLHDDEPAQPDAGQMLLDIPGDPTGGEVVLQPIDPWFLQPLGLGDEHFSSTSSSMNSRSRRRNSNAKAPLRRRGSASLNLNIEFRAVAAFNTSIRLPLLPRTFRITLEDDNGDQTVCGDGSVYRDQTVHCTGLVPGHYTATAVDSDDASLELAQKSDIAVADGSASNEQLAVEMGMLLLEASFGSLAWPGVYARTRITPFGAIIHAQIVGAQIVVYPKTQPDQIWDMQWTGDEGTAPFFLIPGSGDFVANMSVGDTLLASQPVQFSPDANYLSSTSLSQQPQLTQLVADQQLLCTGEVEDVRGESGTFPADIQQLESDGQKVYHPRGFFCRWELLPDYPELTLTVNYTGLMDDESLVLYLGSNNIIKLTKPGQKDAGGVFQATIWVDRSVFIEFQTTRGSTSDVGAFTINWTSSSPNTKGVLTSRTMVVILGCVSAAGAILAAFCFYCVCCSRRRRGMVVVNGEAAAAQRVALLRVPSAVRELLPVKPYQPPEDNPLPGAATEPDCCSICLIEFEAAENVTVLPCMHFYHKECIDSWLARNCTCPLCKANVLQAFQRTQDNSNQQQEQQQPEQQEQQPQQQQHRHRQRRHHRHRHRANRNSGSSDRGESVQLDGGAPAAGDAVVDVTALAAHPLASNGQHGRLPPLPLPRPSPLAAASSQSTAAAGAAAGAADFEPSRVVRSPSPAASIGNLPNGTVECGAADFAAAAAAAAAAIAAESAAAGATDNQAAAASALNSAYGAAQASVTALRGSSRVWGRRLQGLLRTSSNGAAEAAAAGSDRQYAVELGQVPAAGPLAAAVAPTADNNSTAAAVRSPELVMHVPTRGAISIYAYAGHPHAADADASAYGEAYEQPTEQQRQQQQVHSRSATPPVPYSGAAGSSSTAVNHTNFQDNWVRPPSRQNASLPNVTG